MMGNEEERGVKRVDGRGGVASAVTLRGKGRGARPGRPGGRWGPMSPGADVLL